VARHKVLGNISAALWFANPYGSGLHSC